MNEDNCRNKFKNYFFGITITKRIGVKRQTIKINMNLPVKTLVDIYIYVFVVV